MCDDDYDNDPDPCEHLEYDVDCLTGRAYCPQCGEAWWLTSDELRRAKRMSTKRIPMKWFMLIRLPHTSAETY